ncbi:hypothetical protein F5Y16DRAFT_391055 [Xylariaceae sp. FL0255]|nr:hypothetical protein F5Y16DRAFT_391055 [Xylariaceae sp. FL0255]
MCISIQNSSTSAQGVLKSLLAMSSLHRYGLQSRSLEFKIAAIRSLAVASQCAIGTREIIQHIAAAMILGSIEILGLAYTSDEWTQHLCGVRRIILAASISFNIHSDDNLLMLLSWDYYYDTMARFSIQHWQSSHESRILMPPSVCRDVMIQSSPDFDAVDLLAEVCSTLSVKPPISAPKEDIFVYRDHDSLLSGRIRMALKKYENPEYTVGT